jgi:HSP20 family protein
VEVKTMTGLIRHESLEEGAEGYGRLDRLFDEWMRMMPFRPILFPHWREAGNLIPVEEFREDGTLVLRADLPGIDPDKDVEVTVSDGMLRIEAERHADEKGEEKGYVRQELRYGSLSRSLSLPVGVAEAEITATYKDGVLEVRVPVLKRETTAKIAVSRS